jgi:hypothetical protein
MPRVSQAVLRRLDKLDAPLREQRQRAAYIYALAHGIESLPPDTRARLTRAQRTILSWPHIATDRDAWESEASAHQDKIIEWSSEDREKPEPVVTTVGPTNAQADHDIANRAMGEQRRQGGRPYLEAKEQEVRQVTQPPAQPYRARGRGPMR